MLKDNTILCVYFLPHVRVQGIHLLDSLDDGTDMVDPDPFLMLNTPTVDLDTSAVSQE